VQVVTQIVTRSSYRKGDGNTANREILESKRRRVFSRRIGPKLDPGEDDKERYQHEAGHHKRGGLMTGQAATSEEHTLLGV
jgi:hypothetical protein